MLPVRRPRPVAPPPPFESGPVLAASRPSPWLEREMAAENQVQRFAFQTGLFHEDPHPSEILRTRSEARHRLGELYADMPRKDSDLAAFLAKRRDAVLALPHELIAPADATPKAVETADFCRTWMRTIGRARLDTMLRHQLESRPEGVAFGELFWERLARGPLAGGWLPVDYKDRPMSRFLFRDGQLFVRRPSVVDAIAPPAGKFLVMRHGTVDSPWGTPLLDFVYWYWFIKKHAWKFYSVFIEKFASPTARVKYRSRSTAFAGGTEDVQSANRAQQAKALEIAKAIQNDYAIAIPEDLVVDFIEATRSGSVDYNSFIAMCTRGEALVLLGEINTSGLRPGTGAYASDRVADDIRFEKVVLDANDLMGHVREDLLRPIVELNFGPDAPVPWLLIETVAGEDLEQRRRGIALLWAAGLPVQRRYVYLTGQAEDPQPGDDVVLPPGPVGLSPFGGGSGGVLPTPGSTNSGTSADAAGLAAQRHLELATGPARIQLAAAALEEARSIAEGRDGALLSITDAFRQFTVDHFARQQELALQAWDDGHFASGDALRWLVARLDPVAHAQRIHAAQIHGTGLALAALIDDGIDPTRWKTRSRQPAAAAGAPTPGRLPFAAPGGMGNQTTPQTAIDWWARLLNVTKDAFNELDDSSRRMAFTTAGVNDVAMLVEINELGQRAAAEGWSRQRFRDELADVYSRNGLDPTADWHADLIYNNNIRQANGATRHGQIVDNPAAHRLIPYLGWATFGDDSVRARPLHNHVVMANKIFATSHPIWQTWWYPAGHNCRCLVFTINRAKAERMGLVGAEPTGPWPITESGQALPDPGFRGAPNMDAAAAANDDNLTAIATDVQRQGDAADLMGAITALLRALGIDIKTLLSARHERRALLSGGAA